MSTNTTSKLSNKAMKNLIATSNYYDRKASRDLFDDIWKHSSQLSKQRLTDEGQVELDEKGNVLTNRFLEYQDNNLRLRLTLEEFSTRRLYGMLLVQVATDYYTSPEFNQILPDLDEVKVLLKNVPWK